MAIDAKSPTHTHTHFETNLFAAHEPRSGFAVAQIRALAITRWHANRVDLGADHCYSDLAGRSCSCSDPCVLPLRPRESDLRILVADFSGLGDVSDMGDAVSVVRRQVGAALAYHAADRTCDMLVR